jgi:hypothetical protein
VLSRLVRRPLTWVIVALLGIGLGAALYWFQPWKLVVDRPVNEALTSLTPAATPTATPTASQATTTAAPALVGQGRFVSHEHDTSGTVRIIQNPDGSRRLELVDLSTSNGPDLRVWLTDRPVIEGRAGWDVFDDGKYVELGRLKGNRGNQAYNIPPGTDLSQFHSVTIWCKRFSVSFGAAALAAA